MNEKTPKRLLAAALALLLLAAILPGAGAAATSIFVNNAESVLSGDLSTAYAVGVDGSVARLADTYAYAMTARGLETVGYSNTTVPGGLPVSGSLRVSYEKVRVGLYYYDGGSSVRNPTLDYANLENAAGSGYAFGYYDSARVFQELGRTTERAITMSMDKNINTDGGHIGCFHIRLPGSYADFAAAQAAAAQYADGFPAWYEGSYYALVGNYDDAETAAADAAARGIQGTPYSASDRCVVVSRTADAGILFEFDGGSARSLAVSPQNGAQKAQTWFKQQKYYGDFEYVRRSGEKLTVINVVNIEDYVKGVIPYEMSGYWPLEALKAQALCARTFAACHFNSNAYYGFDVTNDAYSQVYRGMNGATANSNAAVDATAGLYITYNGAPISAMYSSSFGGGSESSENVFTSVVPYLRGKVDPYEAASDGINSRSSWTFTYTKSELSAIANRNGCALSTLQSVEATYSDSGNVIAIQLTDVNGRSASFRQSACYNFCTGAMGLYSIHFTIEDRGSSLVFRGGGWGHNVGMSQFGAYAMAQSYGYSYDQIIAFYYTDVALARGYYN